MNASVDSRLILANRHGPVCLWMNGANVRSVTVVGADRRQDSPLIEPMGESLLAHDLIYVTATGLTTSAIPYGSRSFQIDFNFLEHQLWLRSSDGRSATLAFEPQTVASFDGCLMEQLHKLDLHVRINRRLTNCRLDPLDQDVRVRP